MSDKRTLRILVLDDEPKMAKILARTLGREGHVVDPVSLPSEALAALAAGAHDLLLTDLRMPEMTGLELMERARAIRPGLDVIMMTAYASVETAVEAMKRGAADYLIKPFHNEELSILVARVAEARELRAENRALKATLATAAADPQIIAASPAMQAALKRAAKVAATDVTALIRGESGVGKELIASLIHSHGPRRDLPFIRVNCGALPETLIESELFGHVRGSFTGAVETRKGLFQAADGGTIFLDEIGEITPALQVKLLRALQSGEFQRVGDPQTLRVNVRVIAATNQPLERLIAEGRFRSDLFYRLNVVPIIIPPLRERPEDIPALIDHFTARAKARAGRAKTFARDAYALMIRYPWPGNIRELENAVEHAMVLSEGDMIQTEDLPVAVQNHDRAGEAGAPGSVFGAPGSLGSPGPAFGTAGPAFGAHGGPGTAFGASGAPGAHAAGATLEDVERNMLYDALKATGFNHTQAARRLGITRRTLGYRIEKYGLPRNLEAAESTPPRGETHNETF